MWAGYRRSSRSEKSEAASDESRWATFVVPDATEVVATDAWAGSGAFVCRAEPAEGVVFASPPCSAEAAEKLPVFL